MGESVESTNDFFRGDGIRLEVTAAYSPQQNGKAERLNRKLMERVRADLSEWGLDHTQWAEALLTAVYTRNRSPASCATATPFELFHGKTPDVSMLRVWCSPIFALKPKKNLRKLERKAQFGGMSVVVRAGRRTESTYGKLRTESFAGTSPCTRACQTSRAPPGHLRVRWSHPDLQKRLNVTFHLRRTC